MGSPGKLAYEFKMGNKKFPAERKKIRGLGFGQ